MYCIKCGTALSPEAKFCGSCGTAIPTPSTENLVAMNSKKNESIAKGKLSTNWKLVARRILVFITTTTLWIVVGYFISPTIGGTVAENATTTALALLVGWFSVSAEKRRVFSDKSLAILFLTYIPLSFVGAVFAHDAVLRDTESMAKTGQLVYSVILAFIVYQIAARNPGADH